MNILLLHSNGFSGVIIIIIVVVLLFLVLRNKSNNTKSKPPTAKRKRKTLDEARAEGIKEGISIEKENKVKRK